MFSDIIMMVSGLLIITLACMGLVMLFSPVVAVSSFILLVGSFWYSVRKRGKRFISYW